jgi:hypothetical protein
LEINDLRGVPAGLAGREYERVFSRRSVAVLPLLAAALATGACRGKHHRTTVQNEEPPEGGPRIASSLKMSDAAAPAQLLRGFYGLEGGAWRWTAGTFSVLLHPPLASARRGGTLTFSFSIPDVVIQKLKSVTLTAAVGAAKLKTATYSKAGDYTLTADIPAELLAKEAVTVDFSLDKSLPAGSVDQRELGVIATAAGLESK